MVDASAPAVLLALAAALSLLLVIAVARHIGQDVFLPADELLADQVDERGDGGLFGQLRKFVNHAAESSGLLLPGAGEEHHIALYITGGLVVLAVAELPAEVGH